MGNIIKMTPHLANMIAAGEVVERPSSVVKELVENAIDAKASSIKIILKNGGLEEITVVDDGIGMNKEDVLMCFLPHATSKIKTEYDLFRINTLGFRGEAIASIATVSTMKITSSMDGENGYYCTYKAGVMQSNGICSANKGTTVSVSGLFFNTPARLKYLKPAKSELNSISFLIDKLAISHKDIRFTLINDDKIILSSSSLRDEVSLVGEIYGVEAARNVVLHHYAVDGYKVNLVLIKPIIYRSTKLEISLIVNGRYIKNYTLTQAIIDGYQTLLPIGKFPIAIAYLEIDPLLIDVNVHPAKTEIKISDEYNIGLRMTKEIKSKFEVTSNIPTRTIEDYKKQSYQKQTIFDNGILSEPKPNYNPFNNDLKKNNDEIIVHTENKIDESLLKSSDNDFDIDLTARLSKEEPKIIIKEEPKEDTITTKDLNRELIPYMEYVGQVFGTYLIFQNSKGMYLLDQHAAAERVNYEKYYDMLANNMHQTTELIVPIPLEFTKDETSYVLDNLDKFKEIGFGLDQMGEQSFALRVVPLWAKLDNLESIIYDILGQMIDNKIIDVMSFRDSIAKQISCKASIKANHYINQDEIKALLSNLNKCKNPFTCPHGRPTIINLTLSDIEKMFERIQK